MATTPQNSQTAQKVRKPSKPFDFGVDILKEPSIKSELVTNTIEVKKNSKALVSMLKEIRAFELYFEEKLAKEPGNDMINIQIEGGITKGVKRADINKIYKDLYDMIDSFNLVFRETGKAIMWKKSKPGRLGPISFFKPELYDALLNMVKSTKYADMGTSPVHQQDFTFAAIGIHDEILRFLESRSPVSPTVISSILMKLIDIDTKTSGYPVSPSGQKSYRLPTEILSQLGGYVTLAEATSAEKVGVRKAEELAKYNRDMMDQQNFQNQGRVGTPAIQGPVAPKEGKAFNKNSFQYVNLRSFISTLDNKTSKPNANLKDDAAFKSAKVAYQIEYKRQITEVRKFFEANLLSRYPGMSITNARKAAKSFILVNRNSADATTLQYLLFGSKSTPKDSYYKNYNAAIGALAVLAPLGISETNPIYAGVQLHALSNYYQNVMTNSNHYKTFMEDLFTKKVTKKKAKKTKA